MLSITTDASLLNYNTFGIDCRAKTLAVVSSEGDLEELSRSGLLPLGGYVVIGGGSNLVLAERYEGTVVLMANKGIAVVEDNDDELIVEAAAGEVWDHFVKGCIAKGWYGIENLVAIPGTVGASAVQNIGAYGVEAKDRIVSVRAYDVCEKAWVDFKTDECGYGYRESRFKHKEGKRYIVTSVRYRMDKSYKPVLTYKALVDELGSAATLDAATVSRTIEEIRWSKLPKPEVKGNAGSFFKNPVVSESKFDELKKQYPDLAAHNVEGGFKLAAGWLIDRCGWKGRTMGRCGVYEKQALVLVNNGGCSGQEVRELAGRIAEDVKGKFGVTIDCEAEFVGFLN